MQFAASKVNYINVFSFGHWRHIGEFDARQWRYALIGNGCIFANLVMAHFDAGVARRADAFGNGGAHRTHLLAPRRQADTNNDLFSVMNRIQENVIRGGVKAWGRNRLNRSSRRITTREVKGIDQTVSLNRALWNAAELLMQLKAG